MRELLQVVEDNAKAGHLDRALARMAERNVDVPIVVRIAALLAHSQEAGTDLVQALSDIGDRAVDEVESLIRKRGEENSQLMVAPSILALSGIFIALLGPNDGGFGGVVVMNSVRMAHPTFTLCAVIPSVATPLRRAKSRDLHLGRTVQSQRRSLDFARRSGVAALGMTARRVNHQMHEGRQLT